MAEVLGQIGSGLLLIGFSALFIGGLGVFNSVQAYLQGKLGTLATLRAAGPARRAGWPRFVLLQILMLALLASVGGRCSSATRWRWPARCWPREQLPLAPLLAGLWLPSLVGAGCSACSPRSAFALPALGRALSVSPAALFRGIDGSTLQTPRTRVVAHGGVAGGTLVLLVASVPDPRFGLAFVVATAAAAGAARRRARACCAGLARPPAQPTRRALPFELRLALAGLQRRDSPLRAALLSLGSALTLLVACTLVVATLLRTVERNRARAAHRRWCSTTCRPNRSRCCTRRCRPARPAVACTTAPLVLGRLIGVNGEALRDSGDGERVARSARRAQAQQPRGNFDDVVIDRGAWWPDGPRAARRWSRWKTARPTSSGLQVGDRLRFEIMGTAGARPSWPPSTASGACSRGCGWRRIFSDGVLDPFITRHVGAAWMPADQTPRTRRTGWPPRRPTSSPCAPKSLLRETRALMAPRQRRPGGDRRRVPGRQPAGAGQRGGRPAARARSTTPP